MKGLCLKWEEGNKAAEKKIANILARRGSRLHTQQKAAEEQKKPTLRPNDENWQTTASPSTRGDSVRLGQYKKNKIKNRLARIRCRTEIPGPKKSTSQWSVASLFADNKWQRTRGCTSIQKRSSSRSGRAASGVGETDVPKTAGCELGGSPRWWKSQSLLQDSARVSRSRRAPGGLPRKQTLNEVPPGESPPLDTKRPNKLLKLTSDTCRASGEPLQDHKLG